MTKIAGSRSRIRIHKSEAWIRGSGSGSTPKCYGSGTLLPELCLLVTWRVVSSPPCRRVEDTSGLCIVVDPLLSVVALTGHLTSVADPGCLSRIPDPDFYPSRIPDLGSRIQKQQQKRGGEKKFVVITFYVASNFTKLQIILDLKC
jgi:hypothetical protein